LSKTLGRNARTHGADQQILNLANQLQSNMSITTAPI
jgi:hypothetical protein